MKLYKSFIVLGLGRFGTNVATSLFDLGYEVLAVDNKPQIIQEIVSNVTHAVVADATDEAALRSLGVRNFDMAIVAIGDDIEASILTTVILKDLGVQKVLVKANNDLHAKILKKIGADEIVFPEKEMGERIAHNITQSNILDYINLSPEYSIIETTVPKKWNEKTLKEINVRAKYGINIMAVKHGALINIAPNAEDKLYSGDVLVVIGSNLDLDVFKSDID
ncbi:TrkA family potassium uptake protein [Acetivibrio sp. MSJd-27]|jgi:trkA-N domain protein|uniref:potassium channel family protein n=1 Tax=Acetivibrio sp. MSJd-27 TaxID=2841523 RepID=UPI0015AD6203|nr:TrkA family potassium uptake protein [Acetivibrio sp. MSJd-27]MBU5451227.1 TrkA family potassium uptake protein [Acetivibrio sp. MSJd-27]